MPRQRQSKTTAPSGVAPEPPGVSRTQPVRELPAERHGDRQRTTQLQQAAPMAGGGGASFGGMGPVPAANDIFAPTEFPQEPSTAGIPLGPGDPGPSYLPEDPDMLLRAMLSVFPDPDLIGLIRNEAV